MKLAILLCITLCYLSRSSTANRAKDLITLIADVVKTTPPGNKFLDMIENNKLDYTMSFLLKEFAATWTGEFITTKGNCVSKDPTTIPVGRRSLSSQPEKRETVSESQLLNILNSPEGQAIIRQGASGGKLNVPAPKFASGGVKIGSLPVIGNPSGIRGKRETKQAALLRRVRDIVVNSIARDMFLSALDDYTERVALYNVCNCNSFAEFIEWYSKLIS